MKFLLNLIDGILTIYIWIVIITVLLNMLAPHIKNPIVDYLKSIVYPPLNFIRQKMPFVIANGIDFSPLVLILALELLKAII